MLTFFKVLREPKFQKSVLIIN